jgi:hypothetical protein
MRKVSLILVVSALMISLMSCSETTDPSSNPTVKVEALMTNNTISPSVFKIKNPDIQIGAIDSIIIKEYRILLSRLKFAGLDSTQNEKELKAGPFLLVLDSTGKSFVLANGEIPAGTYSKIKFEMHRFASSEISQYANNQTFKDFATAERYSTIIKGLIYIDGQPEEFIFNGTATANLMLNFSPEIIFNENADYVVQMEIDPNAALLNNRGEILDPNTEKDSNDINNAIKDAFKSVKKK